CVTYLLRLHHLVVGDGAGQPPRAGGLVPHEGLSSRLVLLGGGAADRRRNTTDRHPGQRQGDGLVIEGVHPHHRTSEAERLTYRQVQLRPLERVLGDEHPGAGTQDAGTLGSAAGQHPRVVGDQQQRQVERVGELDEPGRLLGGGDVDRAGAYLWLVGDNRHYSTT